MDQVAYTTLRLQQFRSYTDFAVELSPSVNIVVGPNASGKTNLLESLLILSGVSSYRTSLNNVIKSSFEWARLDADTLNGIRSVKLERAGDIVQKSYEINNNTKKRLNFNDTVPIILFEPEHMRLLTDTPELRRDFFDAILSEINPSFTSIKNNYKRALLQRNKLLKNNPLNIKKQIFVWNLRLSELAGHIVSERLKLIQVLNKDIAEVYSQIAGEKTKVHVDYQTDIKSENYESNLLNKLENNLDKDLLRGFTAYGPHREDMAVFIRDLPASITASRGETRTLVLALKMLELKILQSARGVKPLILLDDVFSELDGARRKALTNYLKDHQTVITTTDADVVLKEFAQASNLISL